MELIKINQNASGQNVVSARDLHLFVESKERFSKWFEKQLQFGFIEGVDYTPYQMVHPSNNQEFQDYALTLDCAKEIAMIQRTEKGKEARLYFIEAEKRLVSNTPQTYLEALKALVASEEQKLLLENKVENLQTVLDDLLEWVSIIKVSKHNKVKENAFDWRVLKSKSKELGYAIKKAESPRFGYQNLYHVNVFKACYPQFDYNLK